jgi:propionyl-CoA carboxylase alpha chain
MYYDPMIAKLVVYGATRDHAIERMSAMLDRFCIRGVSHNIPFLAALIAHPRFVEGRLSTNFIAEEYPEGFHTKDIPPEDPARMIVIAASVTKQYRERAATITGQMPGHERKVPDDWVVIIDNIHHPVTVKLIEGGYHAEYNGKTYIVMSDWQFGQPLFEGTFNGEDLCVQVERHNLIYRLLHEGTMAEANVMTARQAKLLALMPVKALPDTSKYLLSPMPGLLVSLAVKIGQEVSVGETLAVIEAMKMENVLHAERDGKVLTLHAKEGDALKVNQPILEFE